MLEGYLDHVFHLISWGRFSFSRSETTLPSAFVAGAWKKWAQEGSHARSFVRPLLPSACYAGYTPTSHQFSLRYNQRQKWRETNNLDPPLPKPKLACLLIRTGSTSNGTTSFKPRGEGKACFFLLEVYSVGKK